MVSEFMLQQTQTARVLQKYEPWLERFPTAASLAAASLADALDEWSGLGYNRRGRFLRDAARAITEQFAGEFPQEPDVLDSLPGIGPYTARAIACFAFDRREIFIETNIRAVYIYHFSDHFADPEAVRDKEILSLIEATLPPTDPRSFYYGLMDYGATLKKEQGSMNDRSAHYTRQSRFQGSLRQARGAILRCLRRPGITVSLEDIAQIEGISPARLLPAALALETEGLITHSGALWRIPE
jgi:A/G-specific adenine glycosylase